MKQIVCRIEIEDMWNVTQNKVLHQVYQKHNDWQQCAKSAKIIKTNNHGNMVQSGAYVIYEGEIYIESILGHAKHWKGQILKVKIKGKHKIIINHNKCCNAPQSVVSWCINSKAMHHIIVDQNVTFGS